LRDERGFNPVRFATSAWVPQRREAHLDRVRQRIGP